MRGLLLEKGIVSGSSSLQVRLRRWFGERPKQLLIVSQIINDRWAFKSHLADYRLPDEVIELYVMTFSHSGEFLLVRTENKRAQAAVEILQNCDATRVADTTRRISIIFERIRTLSLSTRERSTDRFRER